MGGKGGSKGGKGGQVGRPTRASQIKARQAASAASYASYKASQTPAGQAAAAASAAATRGMTAQQAYKAGYRGMSAFGGAYTGGNLGDPNSEASRSYKSTHGEAKYKKMVAEKGYSAPSYTAAGKTAATTRAEQRANNYSGFTEHLSQGDADKAFTNLQKQLKISDPTQSTWSKITSGLSSTFNTAKDVYSHAGNLRNQALGYGLGALSKIPGMHGQHKSQLGIASSALTGDTTNQTYKDSRLQSFFQQQAENQLNPYGWGPDLKSYVGDMPTIADQSFYVRDKVAYPQTAETIKQFPSIAETFGAIGEAENITGRGEMSAFVHQPSKYDLPSLHASDIFAANLSSKDTGEFPGNKFASTIQKAVATGLAHMGGHWPSQANSYVGPDGEVHTNTPGGVGVISGSLPFSQWSPEMKQAFAPNYVGAADAFGSDVNLNLGLTSDVSLGENYKSAWDRKVDAANAGLYDVGEPPKETGMQFSSEADYQNLVGALKSTWNQIQGAGDFITRDATDFDKKGPWTQQNTADVLRAVNTDQSNALALGIENAQGATQLKKDIDTGLNYLSDNTNELTNRNVSLHLEKAFEGHPVQQAFFRENPDNVKALFTQTNTDFISQIMGWDQKGQKAYGNFSDAFANIVAKDREVLGSDIAKTFNLALGNTEHIAQAKEAHDAYAKTGNEFFSWSDPNEIGGWDVLASAVKGIKGEDGGLIKGMESVRDLNPENFPNPAAPSFDRNSIPGLKMYGNISEAVAAGMSQADIDAGRAGTWDMWQAGLTPDKIMEGIAAMENVPLAQEKINELKGYQDRFFDKGSNELKPLKPVTDFLQDMKARGLRTLGIDQQERNRRRDLMMRDTSSSGGNNQFQGVQDIIRQYQQQSSAQEQYDISQIWAGQTERDALYQQGLKDIASDQSLYTKELARIVEDQGRYQAELDRVKAEGTQWGEDPEYQKYLAKVTGDVKGLSDYKTQTQSSLDALTSHLDTFKTSYAQDRQARTSAGIDYAQQWQSATRTPVMGIRANRGFNVSKSPWDTFGRKSRNKTSKDFTYTALNV